MAGIATIADLRDRQEAPQQRVRFAKTLSTGGSSVLMSTWAGAPAAFQGAVPSTAAVPTNLTTGAVGQANGGAAALRLVKAFLHAQGGGVVQAAALLIDRLSHQGGLSGVAAGAQTTNLPTAALTRYTSGEGVMAALEIYTAVGTSATTATIGYTNEAGVAGRASPDVVIGATNNRETNRFIQLPLQQGDRGVRSVESVTLAATTGTAGNFGVTLYKPLVPFPSELLDRVHEADPLLTLGGFLPEILDDACLSFLLRLNGVAAGSLIAELRFAED